MATYQNTYGYLKASLYSASPEKAVIKTRSNSDLNLDLLDCFESSLEEVIYKSYWEAYFDQRG